MCCWYHHINLFLASHQPTRYMQTYIYIFKLGSLLVNLCLLKKGFPKKFSVMFWVWRFLKYVCRRRFHFKIFFSENNRWIKIFSYFLHFLWTLSLKIIVQILFCRSNLSEFIACKSPIEIQNGSSCGTFILCIHNRYFMLIELYWQSKSRTICYMFVYLYLIRDGKIMEAHSRRIRIEFPAHHYCSCTQASI